MQKFLLLALAVVVIVVTCYGMPEPEEGSSGSRVWANNDGKNGDAGASSFSTDNLDIGYAKVSGPTAVDGVGQSPLALLKGHVYKSEVGLVSVEAQSDSAPVKVSTRFGTAGVEAGTGLIGRASLVDGTVSAWGVNFNAGVGADTGVIIDKGIEAKWLGVGGKVAADGIEVCVWFCFGVSW